MKAVLFTALLLHLCYWAKAQPQIRFDQDVVDFGDVKLSQRPFHGEIWFTNTGNEDLVIGRAKTGDGGTYATYPHGSIPPGGRDHLVFVADISRVRRITKSVTVETNCPDSCRTVFLTAKLNVLDLDAKFAYPGGILSCGEVKWGDLDTLVFEMELSGTDSSGLEWSRTAHSYAEFKTTPEVFSCRVEPLASRTSTGNTRYWLPRHYYQPGERARVTLVVRNLFGNVGPFERKLLFYTSGEKPAEVLLRGNFTGKPPKSMVIEDRTMLQYDDLGRLCFIRHYNASGELEVEWQYVGVELVYQRSKNQIGSDWEEIDFDHGTPRWR